MSKSKAQQILERSLVEETTDFMTDVPVDLYGNNPPSLPKDTFLALDYKVKVNWIVDPDYKNWGIRSMRALVPDQKISLKFIESTEDEDIEHDIDWEIKDCEVEYESREDGGAPSLFPIRIEINFDKKSTSLYFQV